MKYYHGFVYFVKTAFNMLSALWYVSFDEYVTVYWYVASLTTAEDQEKLTDLLHDMGEQIRTQTNGGNNE